MRPFDLEATDTFDIGTDTNGKGPTSVGPYAAHTLAALAAGGPPDMSALQLASQRFDDLPKRLLIPPVPPPLPLLRSLDQPSFGQDRHVMRNGRL